MRYAPQPRSEYFHPAPLPPFRNQRNAAQSHVHDRCDKNPALFIQILELIKLSAYGLPRYDKWFDEQRAGAIVSYHPSVIS